MAIPSSGEVVVFADHEATAPAADEQNDWYTRNPPLQQAPVVTRYLRVPAQFSGSLGYSTIPCLPVSLEQCAAFGPDALFGIRSNEYYVDAEALVNGERPFVRAALFRSRSILVLQTAGRPPLLIMGPVDSAMQGTSVSSRISMLRFTPSNAIQLELPDDQDNEQSEDYIIYEFEASAMSKAKIGATSQSTISKALRMITHKPKMDNMLQIVPHGVAAYPRSFYVSSKEKDKKVTLKLKKGSYLHPVLRKLTTIGLSFVIPSSNSTLRLILSQPVTQNDIQELNNLPEVAKVIPEGRVIKTVFSETHTKTTLDENTVIITRMDGSGISKEVAQTLIQTLKLKLVRLSGTKVFATAEPDDLTRLHELVVNNRYVIIAPTLEEGNQRGEENRDGTPPV